jgi:hypothetical protein
MVSTAELSIMAYGHFTQQSSETAASLCDLCGSVVNPSLFSTLNSPPAAFDLAGLQPATGH